MYTKGFWIILASCGQIGSKVVWGKCVIIIIKTLVATSSPENIWAVPQPEHFIMIIMIIIVIMIMIIAIIIINPSI